MFYLDIKFNSYNTIGHWSYDNVKQWNRGNRYCAGNLQSPINLQFNLSHYDNRLQRFYFEERFPRGKSFVFNI